MIPETWAALVVAIGTVESGWRCDLPRGAAGEVGPLQVTPVVIEELHRRGVLDDGRPWIHDRCYQPGYSMRIARAYLEAVAPGGSAEDWARRWRKTGNPHCKTASRYWLRVHAAMIGAGHQRGNGMGAGR